MVAQTTPEQPVIAQNRPTSRLDKPLALCIAELVVKYRLTESEACLSLNVRPKTWFNWKVKQNNSGKYDDILSRIRAGQLQNVIQAIDKAGDGIGMKQPDWRAKAWIAERVLAPERFGDRQAEAQATPTQLLADFTKALTLFMQTKKQSQSEVIDVELIKQLPAKCNNDTQLNSTEPKP